ncbi:Mu transposase C-terminal domain-containing protein [Caulobacter flavus]|uniref:Mu transposase C-terminal domain-containing protein n=1 Tax=Caulobacter flavus TaxID=1679497 RepID=UPI0015DDD3A0|nr:Mu transposase C-terminal domain-containing protein [Caulobacter flavus]
MPKLAAADRESKLRTRFRVALAFAQGDLSSCDYGEAARTLGISAKTVQRDIQRLLKAPTFEEWRPEKRGPKKGKRRTLPAVYAVIEEKVYADASKKLNVAKLGRDLDHILHNQGFNSIDIPSPSTLERIVEDIEAADHSHFALRRHGRKGRRDHSLQDGSLETTRPLEIVCIDHTPLDHRTFALGDEDVSIRPTATAVIDIHTSVCLAAFVSLFPPSATTVALAMALSAIPKTEILQAYGLPGEWEAGGVGETLYVDGAAELNSEAVEWGCKHHNTELRVGWPGYPERRGRMERIWGTLTTEIHNWEGTTLSNTEELKRHGGQKPPAWNLEEVQRRFLIAAMEYNNETYGGPKIPPIMQWRDLASLAAVNRRIPRNPAEVFIDFLPYEAREITFEGIRFENCFYRSGELAKLRYNNVKSTTIRYDPRDVKQIWIEGERGYVAIPRTYPKQAPAELFALRRWGKRRSQIAQEKKDSELLRKLAAAKERRWSAYFGLDTTRDEEPIPFGGSPSGRDHARSAPPALSLLPPETPQIPQAPGKPPSDTPGPDLPPNFSIPNFKPRLK